jgi:hypothetical protein
MDVAEADASARRRPTERRRLITQLASEALDDQALLDLTRGSAS